MPGKRLSKLEPVSWTEVRLRGGMWGDRQRVNRQRTLPMQYEKCRDRIRALKLDWTPDSKRPRPHIFWDSDLAKWIEAAAYSLAIHPDAKLQRRVDGVIDKLVAIQMKDGYLNSHFQQVRPRDRWKNLRDEHELYCAGHLMEAAVAYHRATGKRKLMDAMCRYADHIDRQFGRERGKKRGYPGHQEIELALVKLYGETGKRKYLELAKYFIDERGRKPHYFDLEAKQRGDKGPLWLGDYTYWQAHLPVRRQHKVVGHSVRALYFLTGVADVAAQTGDRGLLQSCRRLWRNLVARRMYVTGGVGSTHLGERFTLDYDLPNETCYAETCAAIALVFFAQRMLNLEADAQYADVMERALYNGVISGVNLRGDRFFYDNYIGSYPGWHPFERRKPPTRQGWFDCACCPPNLARLLSSLGGYVYSRSRTRRGGRSDAIYVHLYAAGEVTTQVGDAQVNLRQKTEYPWKGRITLEVNPAGTCEFTLALRIPGWCRAARAKVNGRSIRLKPITRRGYAHLLRRWKPGDRVEIDLAMPVERIEANPKVRQDRGRMALQRGPIVYCLEQADNGPDLNALVLDPDADFQITHESALGGLGGPNGTGVTTLRTRAHRELTIGWGGDLYRPAGRTKTRPVRIRAIPYFAWANRPEGEMLVWLRQGP